MRIVLRLALVAAVGLVPSTASAHIPLVNPSNHANLKWNVPGNISVVINATGSDDIHDKSHITALQSALRAWNEAPGSTARLVENTAEWQRARTDWSSDDVHLILFDEDDSSGYFSGSTGIVALTPVYFAGNGRITDADILFNGGEFHFTTRGESGSFDVADVGTHELGHFLGLDHSGWAGASMYPYVDPTIVLHRSLSQDDVCGLRESYPSTTYSTIHGIVRRADDSIVPGAHVVARGSDGRPYASALCTYTGAFTIIGLVADTYTLYASPLDFPVSAANLGGGHSIATNFQSTVFGAFAVAEGQDLDIGNRTVNADATVLLGRNVDDFPIRCVRGQTMTLTLHGAGLVGGTTLVPSDPSITVNPLVWATNLVTFQVVVPGNEPIGHFDLQATTTAGDRSILCAGLEITPRSPVVNAVTPPSGTIHGGDALVIQGTHFRPGASVVIGPRVYVDGAAGGCVVQADDTITLTTAAMDAGEYDVVVIDASGVEGRLLSGFEAAMQPSVTSLFPSAGAATGGTPLVVRGVDFAPGCVVSIEGVVQSGVKYVDAWKLEVSTAPGVPGGPYTVVVQNPGGESASAAYSYASDPDPVIDAITPAAGSEKGGQQVTIHGANFSATTDVYFGKNAETGAGGVLASSITFVDANTLLVVTPAFSSGAQSVVAIETSTDQAAVAAAAYTFQSEGGGGGGCFLGTLDLRRPPFEGLSSMALLLAAWLLLALRARALSSNARRAPIRATARR
jgi:hypothetical protein